MIKFVYSEKATTILRNLLTFFNFGKLRQIFEAFSEFLNFKDDEEHDLILAVAKQLNVKTSVEMETIRAILFPSILCAAVFTGDFILLCHEKQISHRIVCR